MSRASGSTVPEFGGHAPEPLRALARLVLAALNDAGTRLVTPLVPVVVGGSADMTIEVSSTPRRRPSPGTSSVRHGHRTGAAPVPPTEPAEPVEPTEPAEPVEYAVEQEHVEVWELVTRAQAGDGHAFGQLYDRYVDTVYRFIYFRVNDRTLAEDFTSETFLRALRRIGTISYQGRDIGAWFVTIARNIVLDHMKSARHRLEYTTGDTIEGDDRAPSPETAVLEQLTNERLMAAVHELGDEQRECVMLRFIQGFSVSETAAVMGKNDGAVKALQHRAVRKLADLIGGDLR
jgi:RNA polymerase sigma-70 factor, ECF subfamily